MTAKTDTKARQEVNAKIAAHDGSVDIVGNRKAIDSNLNSVKRALDKADDHRLKAAVAVAVMAEACEAAKVRFSRWAKLNLSHSYETVRKLRPIGEAEIANEGDGAAMLAEMREKNRIANAEMRARKAAGSNDDDDGDGETSTNAPSKAKDPEAAIVNIFTSLSPEEQAHVLETLHKLAESA